MRSGVLVRIWVKCMKTSKVPLAALLTSISLAVSGVIAQGAVVTYQGQLVSTNGPVSGTVSIEFRLYSAAIGGVPLWVEQHEAVTVTSGLFTLTLGQNNPVDETIFDGSARWLGISVGGAAQLTPRAQVTATPYAITARHVTGVVGSSSLAGTYDNALTFSNQANQFSGNGAGLSGVNAATLDGRAAAGFWQTGGNAGTLAGTHFVGTTDNQALELRVNNQRALRLEPTAMTNTVNVLANPARNIVSGGLYGVTVAGGLDHSIATEAHGSAIGGGEGNRITLNARNSTIAGGAMNDSGSIYSVVGGGFDNNIASGSQYSTIAGGLVNDIASSSYCSSIGAGENNNIAIFSPFSTIAGGVGNDIGFNSSHSTIGGGLDNNIAEGAAYATIPGGQNNFATNSSFAAGTRAKARHLGTLVWGDASLGEITSTNANSLTMRAAGGFRLFSDSDATLGAYLAPGDGTWSAMSDRNAKENFEPVNPRAVLDKVAALPVSTWNYKSQTNGVRHIGPMAQDFKAAFAVGGSDTGITTIDADGVALAAIQGLNQKLEEKDAEIRELKRRLTRLEELLNR